MFYSGCASRSSNGERNDSTVDHVKVVVMNKGSKSMYQVKVHIGPEQLNLGSFGPGIVASRKFFPRAEQIGKMVALIVEYEDEDEEIVRLEGTKALQIFAKGELRLEIAGGKLIAEKVSRE